MRFINRVSDYPNKKILHVSHASYSNGISFGGGFGPCTEISIEFDLIELIRRMITL